MIPQKFIIFTKKNSQSDTFFPKLKSTIVKIDIKSFSVYISFKFNFCYSFQEFIFKFSRS